MILADYFRTVPQIEIAKLFGEDFALKPSGNFESDVETLEQIRLSSGNSFLAQFAVASRVSVDLTRHPHAFPTKTRNR